MDKKKIIAIIVSAVVVIVAVIAVIVAVNQKDDGSQYVDTEVTTIPVTDENGKNVTDKNGDVVTQQVTGSVSGNASANASGNASGNSSGNAQTGSNSGNNDAKTTTKKKFSIFNKKPTTKKETTTKVTTTRPKKRDINLTVEIPYYNDQATTIAIKYRPKGEKEYKDLEIEDNNIILNQSPLVLNYVIKDVKDYVDIIVRVDNVDISNNKIRVEADQKEATVKIVTGIEVIPVEFE